MRRKACIGKAHFLSLCCTRCRLQSFGNLCDKRVGRELSIPVLRENTKTTPSPLSNKPTQTYKQLREHTKSRPRKIPEPSHRDVAARIAVVKRMTHEGRKFIFAPGLREGHRCGGRRPVAWSQRPRGDSERHAHGTLTRSKKL